MPLHLLVNSLKMVSVKLFILVYIQDELVHIYIQDELVLAQKATTLGYKELQSFTKYWRQTLVLV